MKYRTRLFAILILPTVILNGGCTEMSNTVSSATKPSWHHKFGWDAEDFFTDPQLVALCRAIEAEDLDEIDRLVAAGVDVDAIGKGNMTPLLWAFPDNKPDRFARLLQYGADPNVMVSSNFNTGPAGIQPGDSVTHIAAKSSFPHFKLVMEHGGDPNFVHPKYKETPLFSVIKGSGGEREERIQLLIDKGADLDYVSGLGATPAIQAVSWGGQYRYALMLLEAGADPDVYQTGLNSKLIHVVVGDEKRLAIASPEQKQDYRKLVRWLESHGESVEKAREDHARWDSWFKFGDLKKINRLHEAEIAARRSSEQAEQENAAMEDGGRR